MKDPAFLFYTSDFITGTMFMSNEEVGIYIRLLCAQHQQGGLISKTAFNQLVKDSEILRTKFIEVEEGFFNERLMKEMERRSIKSSNLSDNAKIRWKKQKEKLCKSNAIASELHMPTVNENEDVIITKNKSFIIPQIKEILEYCQERKNNVDAQKFFDFYESKGWMVGKNKMKDWKAAVRTWENSSKPNTTQQPTTVTYKRNPAGQGWETVTKSFTAYRIDLEAYGKDKIILIDGN